jgi:DNA-binding CsgD family transcriptional regulator/tetratricopeptide (TPR) repeat protein
VPAAFDEPVVCPRQIGRDDQLGALRQVAARVATGSGQTVLVAGEAGIGKSRLVREFAGRLGRDGWVIQQGNCFERDRLLPYAPFLDALHALLTTLPPGEIERSLGPALPDLARLLPELGLQPAAPFSDPEQDKRRIFHALGGTLSRLAARQPLLLVIEDLHWADETSLELLAVLARRVPREPILLLGTYRDDEVSGGLGSLLDELDRGRLAVELRLARLGRDEVAAMLRAIFGLDRPVRQDFLLAIYALAEGNPFFIEELLRSLVAAGDAARVAGGWDRQPVNELRLPRTVHDAVRRRTDRVSPEARQVLVLAAVAGRRFDFELLRNLTGRDEAELLRLIGELVAAQLVVEVEERGDQFAFRHALTRQAVYEQLLGRERRGVHRRIADTLERLSADSPDPRLDDLAHHFSEAGAWAKALVYAERAGARADALYAPASAAEHYARAIEAARRQGVPVPARLHRARGLAHERLGDFDLARADHEAALVAARAAGDRQAEWQALLDLGFLWSGRAYDRTRAYFAEALELARTLDDPLALARSLNRVGNWHLNREQTAEAGRCHREALAIFERLGDRRGVAETLDLLGLVEYMQGDLVDAIGHNNRAIALFRELDDRAGLTSALAHPAAGMLTYHSAAAPTLPEFAPQAIRKFEEAIQIAQELGWRASEAFGRAVLAMALGPRGEYARALAEVQTALHIAEDIDHRQWTCAARYTLGEIHRDLLDLDEARRQFEQALRLARELGSGNWITSITGALASTLLASAGTAPAAALLEGRPVDDARPATMGQRQVRLATAELALRQGEAERALRLLENLRGEGAAEALRHVAAAPAVDLVRARALRTLARLDEAEAALLSAYELATACNLASVTWRLRAELAAVFDAQGRGPRAGAARAEALAIVERLAQELTDVGRAEGFLARARRVLGIAAPSRRLLRRGPGGLTVRELEIARLIAQGHSNRAMAECLVLSERTIEDHVSGILSKLGFSSRAQIAAWATQQGLVRTEPA